MRRIARSSAIAELQAAVDALAVRLERFERRRERFDENVLDQQSRSDAVVEDLVAAIDRLRRRVEELERDRAPR